VELSKYLVATLTDQNCIEEEIESRLKTVNAAIIRCLIFCLAVCYPKISRFRYTEL